MFRCEKVVRFEASHQLPHHDGKCARLHGHSWVARIICEGQQLTTDGPKRGMLVDYGDMKAVIEPLVEQYLDHHHLNDTLESFGITDPTSEEIARWMFNQIAKTDLIMGTLSHPSRVRLVEVHVEETCTSRAVYRPDPSQ